MSFEDLQATWGRQFTEGADNSAAEQKLLERIHEVERRFRLAVWLRAACDAIWAGILVWLIVISIQFGEPLPRSGMRAHRHILAVALVVSVALYAAVIRLNPLGAPPSSRDGAAVLPGRLYRDGIRFYAWAQWAFLREVIVGLFFVGMAVVRAWHATQYAMFDWAAVALLAAALAGLVLWRLRSPRYRPVVNDTVLGMLEWSTEQTRHRLRLLENILWYAIPIIAGVILLGPVHDALARGGAQRPQIVGALALVAGGWVSWRINRWVAHVRLRPRLAALEKLQKEISGAGTKLDQQ